MQQLVEEETLEETAWQLSIANLPRSQKHVSKAPWAHSHSISQSMARVQPHSTISLTNYPNKCWACCLDRHSTPLEYSNTLANQQLIWNGHFLKPLCWHSYVCVNREGFGWPCKKRLTWTRWLYTKRVFIPGFSLFLKKCRWCCTVCTSHFFRTFNTSE